ncbi:hypothetical protein VT84_36800 [Gemmata sp. SH-PL17]|uniref:hypothetical protein n=1 Tax=Gemmata sp. SH-PL17 TaxID=1630693 RepID=UPI00078C0F23|nr:hypothetical protein [Gemmata sp. SH-PL17]AMV30011.1 hypothetical protein VT84_36800 [Gemmata sp. SH-PL17]
MPTYVILWENNTVGHKAVSGKTWSGHAAMNIGDKFQIRDKRGGEKCYVSWWPQSAQKFSGFGIALKTLVPTALSKEGLSEQFFIQDIVSEKYLPDHVIRLDTNPQQENNMRAAWKEISNTFSEKGTKYHALRQNCSTIVSRVLHAGGYHGFKWSVDTKWAWSPADIRKLVRGQGHFMKWKEFLVVLDKSGIKESDLPSKQARSGRLCTTGAPCRFQQGEEFYWRNR